MYFKDLVLDNATRVLNMLYYYKEKLTMFKSHIRKTWTILKTIIGKQNDENYI